MKRIVHMALAALFILAAWPARPASADEAPLAVPALGGPQLLEVKKTKVQLVTETIVLELQSALGESGSPFGRNRLHVTAIFRMKNLSILAETLQVAFPLTTLSAACLNVPAYKLVPDSFKLKVDDNETAFTVQQTENPNGALCPQTEWAVIEQAFPALKDVTLVVDYDLDPVQPDYAQAFQYLIATGAGWQAGVEKAEIVFRVPYDIQPDSLLLGTSPRYDIDGNELRWVKSSFEPSANDNIFIAFIEPRTWYEIIQLREDVKANFAPAWFNLARQYERVGVYNDEVRYQKFYQLAFDAYGQAIGIDTKNPDYYAAFGNLLFANCCGGVKARTANPNTPGLIQVMRQIEIALQLDPDHVATRALLAKVNDRIPGIAFAPPPTSTATFTLTPTVTLTPEPTLTPTQTLWPTATLTLTPTVTNTVGPTLTPTLTPIPMLGETESRTVTLSLIIPMFILAAIGGFIYLRRQQQS